MQLTPGPARRWLATAGANAIKLIFFVIEAVAK
jgi:hypothetical protein